MRIVGAIGYVFAMAIKVALILTLVICVLIYLLLMAVRAMIIEAHDIIKERA